MCQKSIEDQLNLIINTSFYGGVYLGVLLGCIGTLMVMFAVGKF